MEVVVGAGGLPPTPKDNIGAEVGPEPTPRRGAEVPPFGSSPTERRGAEVGPEPTPSSVPVGSTPRERIGAEVGPIPAPMRFPDVGATPTERRGSEVGPTAAPRRGPEVGATPRERIGSEVGPNCSPKSAPPSAADDEDPESLPPPRTGDRRPPATPPKSPLSADEAAVYRSISQGPKYLESHSPSTPQQLQTSYRFPLLPTSHPTSPHHVSLHPAPTLAKRISSQLYKKINCRKEGEGPARR